MALPLCTTLAPHRLRLLIRPEIAFSLPGTAELAIRMVSPSPTRILWSRLAIRASAAIGSPWDPVQINVALFGASRSSWSSGTIRPLGTVR